MSIIKKLLIILVGKKINNKSAVSKAKLTAFVYVVMNLIPEVGKIMGHPIEIPPIVYRILEGLGLWSIRDAIK